MTEERLLSILLKSYLKQRGQIELDRVLDPEEADDIEVLIELRSEMPEGGFKLTWTPRSDKNEG